MSLNALTQKIILLTDVTKL